VSAALLLALVSREALRPPVDWKGLAEAHVSFDELTGTDRHEQVLQHATRRDDGATLVLGSTGSGKSSMIAAVAASASPNRWVVRVQGGSAPDLLEREGFVRHIGNEAMRSLTRDDLAPPADAQQAEARLADAHRMSSGGHLFGTKMAQVKSAVEEVTRGQNASDLYAAMDELSAVSAEAGRRMLLIVEDTDVFMPPSDLGGNDARERADRFISQVLPFLARELRCPSLIAVNGRYRGFVDVHLRGTVDIVEVPRFPQPVQALEQIMARQALRKNLHIIEPVIDADALEWLAAALEHGASLRDVLRAINDAATRATRETADATSIPLAAVMASL
jgi:MoxR-like ATPase